MQRAGFLGFSILITIIIVLFGCCLFYNSGGTGFVQYGTNAENGLSHDVSPSIAASAVTTAAAVQNVSGLGVSSDYGNVRMASALPSASPLAASQNSSPANWDEQLGLSFTQDFTSLAYNVTAVQQADVDGYGPAYLLNGLTSAGYWYQVGLSWDWPYTTGGYNEGFNMNYEVFNPAGGSIFPAGGDGGITSITGTVNPGDTVGLYLYFSNGNVVMSIYDFNTGASAQESYSAEGSTLFVGTPNGNTNSNGFFTGLMTEQYHVSPYYEDESAVHYSDTTFSLSSGWMFISERNVVTNQILFNDQSFYQYSSPSFQTLSSNGATEYSNANDFITGSGDWIPTTMSYHIVDGGTPTSAPALNYTMGGIQYSVTLGTSPSVFYMDAGSTWTVTNPLTAGSSTEEWATPQSTGVVNSSQSINIAYYNQYLLNFSYGSSTAGTPPSSPTVVIVQCGVATSVVAPVSTYADAGSQYSYQNPIPGSSPDERWSTAASQGTVLSSSTVAPLYYCQYALNASYSVMGGGNPGQIFLNGTSQGSPVSVALQQTAETVWLDEGSNFNLPATVVNALSTERWCVLSALNGLIEGPTDVSAVYQNQFYLNMGTNSAVGGSVTPSNEWVPAGQTVQIDATPDPNWRFGGWVGSGSSSYSGNSSSVLLTIDSPMEEDSLFYPGITVSAGSDGAISYSCSQYSGSVTGGVSSTLFVPQNGTVSLTAHPSSFFYQFGQWSGSVNSTSPSITLIAQEPIQIQAIFVLNWANIGIVGAIVIAVACIVSWVVVRKMKEP